jgi:hypothetical protein
MPDYRNRGHPGNWGELLADAVDASVRAPFGGCLPPIVKIKFDFWQVFIEDCAWLLEKLSIVGPLLE